MRRICYNTAIRSSFSEYPHTPLQNQTRLLVQARATAGVQVITYLEYLTSLPRRGTLYPAQHPTADVHQRCNSRDYKYWPADKKRLLLDDSVSKPCNRIVTPPWNSLEHCLLDTGGIQKGIPLAADLGFLFKFSYVVSAECEPCVLVHVGFIFVPATQL